LKHLRECYANIVLISNLFPKDLFLQLFNFISLCREYIKKQDLHLLRTSWPARSWPQRGASDIVGDGIKLANLDVNNRESIK